MQYDLFPNHSSRALGVLFFAFFFNAKKWFSIYFGFIHFQMQNRKFDINLNTKLRIYSATDIELFLKQNSRNNQKQNTITYFLPLYYLVLLETRPVLDRFHDSGKELLTSA